MWWIYFIGLFITAAVCVYLSNATDGEYDAEDFWYTVLFSILWPLAIAFGLIALPLVGVGKLGKRSYEKFKAKEAEEEKAALALKRFKAEQKAEEERLFAIAEGKPETLFTRSGPVPNTAVHRKDCLCVVCLNPNMIWDGEDE